uniref:Uncharacterized protein n=1 Tax=Lepeophtheirus salmonis TaxID=72036 RepID=A0A0K2VJ25_LEPSM
MIIKRLLEFNYPLSLSLIWG